MSETGEGGGNSGGNGSGGGEINSELRPRVYKIKEDLNKYYDLINEHLVSTCIYDFYMELKPNVFRKLHQFTLGFSKFVRILFLHFLFYHTIWYFPFNRNRRSTPFNIDYLDVRLTVVLFYLNFYHVLVHKFLLNTVLCHLVYATRMLSYSNMRVVLRLLEILIFTSIDLFLVYVLRYKCSLSLYMIGAILLPHIAFKLNRYFILNFTLFGWCVYRNTYSRDCLPAEKPLDQAAAPAAVPVIPQPNKFVYNDCSNIPMSTYLNKKISTPNLYISTGLAGNDPVKVRSNNSFSLTVFYPLFSRSIKIQ